MKLFFIILLFPSVYFTSIAQEITTEEIRSKFKYINSQKDYQTLFLVNDDYVEHIDMGLSAKAYFRKDTLYKIIEKTYFNHYNSTTEYYYWENELFFVFTSENRYDVLLDKDSSFLEFNYEKQYNSYTARLYFDKKKEIKRIEKGETFSFISHDINAESLKDEFINVHDNFNIYLSLQGTWIEKKNKNNSLTFDKRTVEIKRLQNNTSQHYIIDKSTINTGWYFDETHSNEYRIEKINLDKLVLFKKSTKEKVVYIRDENSIQLTKLFNE